MIRTIVWDFNGTVLDDRGASTAAVNHMMARRGLGAITEEWYAANLIMPLEAFYESVGFDMRVERIERLSEEFQQECAKVERPIFPEVRLALEQLRQKGYRQLLFSSLHQSILEKQAKERGISKYFEKIMGRSDRLLGSKEEASKAYLLQEEIPPETVLFVGDLTTDWEMAEYVGSPCVLIPKGHQGRERLSLTNATILKDASELLDFLKEME